MKLNREGKVELRAIIEQKLEGVPDGQRVHIDKDLLEQLLFDTYIEELGYGVTPDFVGKKVPVKYIVWSGPFLSKIDLSEISFDDVMWSIIYNIYAYFAPGAEDHYVKAGVQKIDLSNTNANIDFSKSFGCKYAGPLVWLYMGCCDFSNTDLSNNLIECIDAESCNFSNTGLRVNLNTKDLLVFCNSDLSGLDFSEYTVGEDFFRGEKINGKPTAYNCNLSGTGLRVITTTNIGEALRKDSMSTDDMSTEERTALRNSLAAMDSLAKTIKAGHLVGCYVNDKPILSQEQRQGMAQEKRDEYEKMKVDTLATIIQSIDQQVEDFGRK